MYPQYNIAGRYGHNHSSNQHAGAPSNNGARQQRQPSPQQQEVSPEQRRRMERCKAEASYRRKLKEELGSIPHWMPPHVSGHRPPPPQHSGGFDVRPNHHPNFHHQMNHAATHFPTSTSSVHNMPRPESAPHHVASAHAGRHGEFVVVLLSIARLVRLNNNTNYTPPFVFIIICRECDILSPHTSSSFSPRQSSVYFSSSTLQP